MPKTEELESLSKSEKLSLNRLYCRGKLAYDYVQTLKKQAVCQKKVEQFLQSKTSNTKFGPPIRRFGRFQAFQNPSRKIGVWTWL